MPGCICQRVRPQFFVTAFGPGVERGAGQFCGMHGYRSSTNGERPGWLRGLFAGFPPCANACR